MAVNDIITVTIRQSLHSQTLLNVLHYQTVTEGVGGTAGACAALNALIEGGIIPAMKAVQSAELTHVSVTSQKIWPAPTELAVTSTAAAGAGGVAGSSLPTSNAVVITKRTANAGRKYRGRVYVGGIPSASEDNSNLAAAAVGGFTTLAALLDNLLNDMTYSFRPQIYHRATHLVDRVTDAVVRLPIRNQRRRQVGVGE